MVLRFPPHIWAMLSCGREAESLEVVEFDEGIGCGQRWREYDGERNWEWTNRDCLPRARTWTTFFVRRMAWWKEDGKWYGEWMWSATRREEQWVPDLNVNLKWLNMGNLDTRCATHSTSAGGDVPQEVLLYMLQHFDWVGPHRLLSRRLSGLYIHPAS